MGGPSGPPVVDTLRIRLRASDDDAGLLTFDGSGPLFVPLYSDGSQPESRA